MYKTIIHFIKKKNNENSNSDWRFGFYRQQSY